MLQPRLWQPIFLYLYSLNRSVDPRKGELTLHRALFGNEPGDRLCAVATVAIALFTVAFPAPSGLHESGPALRPSERGSCGTERSVQVCT
jgi:hypothetical protein